MRYELMIHIDGDQEPARAFIADAPFVGFHVGESIVPSWRDVEDDEEQAALVIRHVSHRLGEAEAPATVVHRVILRCSEGGIYN